MASYNMPLENCITVQECAFLVLLVSVPTVNAETDYIYRKLCRELLSSNIITYLLLICP